MVESVVIIKTVISGIVWWVDINKFYFASEAFLEGMENHKIIAFNNKVVIWF